MDRSELADEAEHWVDEGIITQEQADEILARYDDDGRSRTVKIVALVGAVLVGAGILLFVGANWERVPRPAQLAFLGLTTGLLVGAGVYLDGDRDIPSFGADSDYPRISDALYLAGAVSAAVSVWLAEDILSLGADETLVIFAGAVAAGAVAYAAATVPALVFADILFGGWFVSLADDFFFPSLAFYGVALYGAAYAHRSTRWDGFVPIHKAFGALAALVGVFAVVIAEEAVVPEETLFTAVVFAVALLGVAVVVFVWRAGDAHIYEAVWAVAAVGVAAYAVFAGEHLLETVFLVVLNLAFFGLVLLTLVAGYTGRSRYVFNVGVLGFVIYLVYVYVSTVFEAVPSSLALVVGGLLLLGGGYYLENKRRDAVGEMEA